LGEIKYELTEKIKKNKIFSCSLFVVKDMKIGETYTEENIRSIRPDYCLHTRFLKDIMGQKATRNIERGTPLDWKLISYNA